MSVLLHELPHRIVGCGESLLLIHGFGISYEIWRNLVPLLTSHFRLVIVELPGIGQSPFPETDENYFKHCARRLNSLRITLGIDRWSLLGYSLGTRVLSAYTQAYPQTVHKAIFLCPLILLGWRWLAYRLFQRSVEGYPGLLRWLLTGWRLHYLILLLGFSGRRTPLVAEWKKIIILQDRPALQAMLLQVPSPGRDVLTSPVPSAYIWARNDVVSTNCVSTSPFHYVINADHSAPVTCADSIAEVARSFLLS